LLTDYRAMFASAGVHPMELGLVQARAARVFTGVVRMHGWSFDVAGHVLQ
jgi:hypothetical protein